jgi:hypothetical protein
VTSPTSWGKRTSAGRRWLAAAIAAALVWPAVADAAPERPVNEPATNITARTATLHGELNSGSASEELTFEFRYAASAESCFGGFAAPEPAGKVFGNRVKVATPITGLVGNTTYGACLVAFNNEGEVAFDFPPELFTTSAERPAAGEVLASNVSPFDAELRASVKSENEETTYSFEYASNSVFNGATRVGEGTVPPSAEEQAVGPVDVGKVLTPGTTYFVRLTASNATGDAKGPVAHFTTLPADSPTVSGETASPLSTTEARLEADVNPNFQATTCKFQYVAEAAFVVNGYAESTEVPCEPESVGEGNAAVSVGATLSGLKPGTSYHYRVRASNATGVTTGPDNAFTTLAPPVVVTGAARDVEERNAVLAGKINPGGVATSYRFLYIDQAGYEAGLIESPSNPYAKGRATTPEIAQAGSTTVDARPSAIGELRPGTTYHFAILATSVIGTALGADATFSTAGLVPPAAVTGEAVGVTSVSATLLGSADSKGSPSAIWFEFGTAPSGGTRLLAQPSLGAAEGTSVGVKLVLQGVLQPGTTYFYRVLVESQDGIAEGEGKSFTTTASSGMVSPMPAALIAFPSFAFPVEPAPPKSHKSTQRRKPTKRRRHKAHKARGHAG